MALTQDDIEQIGKIVADVTAPMFEHVVLKIDGLETRMDRLENRIDGLETQINNLENKMSILKNDFSSFRAEVYRRFDRLERRVDELESKIDDRLENVYDDIGLLFVLVRKLEKGTKEEKLFAEKVIVDNLPQIYRMIKVVAKQHNIKLAD